MIETIEVGNLAFVVKKITGAVSSYDVGEQILVKHVCDDWCTIEDTRGKGCIVGVPLSHIKLVE